MKRIKLTLALMSCVFSTLSFPALTAAAPTEPAAWADQPAWPKRKTTVTLPNGLRMAYVELGNPAGEPLLLLHGYTDTSRSWSLAAPHLSRYRLLIPDQRGHGATDAPACCYTVSDFANDARLFMDALGVERAAVAGHSLGSMVAMHLAAEHPKRVARVVLVGSTGLVPIKRGDWLWSNVMAMRFPIDRGSQFMRDWDPANQPTPVEPAFAAALREELFEVPPQVWRGVVRELAGMPAARHASDVRAPVLVLSGEKDPLFPREHHDALLAAFPGAEGHVLPGLGHNPLWERPAAVARYIDDFLRR